MAATLSQLRDELYAAFPQIRQNPEFPVAQINLWLSDGSRFAQMELNGLGMKRWEASAVLSLTPGQIGRILTQKAPIPTDMLESPTSINFIDCGGSNLSIAGPPVIP